jgi:hypothetical protein
MRSGSGKRWAVAAVVVAGMESGEVWSVEGGFDASLGPRIFTAHPLLGETGMLIIGVRSARLPVPDDHGAIHVTESIHSVMDGGHARLATITSTVSCQNPSYTVTTIQRVEERE